LGDLKVSYSIFIYKESWTIKLLYTYQITNVLVFTNAV